MKVLMVFCALALGVLSVQGQVRRWTMPDGKTMVGAIRSATVDTVVLVRKSDGRTFTLPMDLLKTPDRLAVVQFLEKKERAEEEKLRLEGLESGVYSKHVTGEWEKLKSREGVPFYFYAGTDLKKGLEYPLVVHLHGKAGNGLTLEAVDEGAKAFGRDASYLKRPCFVVAPLCPTGKSWKTEAKKVKALVAHVMENLPVDRSRVYVAGDREGAGVLVADGGRGYAGALLGAGSAKVSGVPVRTGKGEAGEAWLFEQKRKSD